MAINRQKQSVSYGLSQALIGAPPEPIVSTRAPTTSDKAELGTVWTNKSTNAGWVLASIVANSATWTPTTVNAGATIDTGNLVVSTGDITVTLGNITSSAGTIAAELDLFAGRSVFVAGDEGSGVVATTAFTNVVDTTLGAGVGTVLMKTVGAADSTGWMKLYVGTNVRYIPFWTNISP